MLQEEGLKPSPVRRPQCAARAASEFRGFSQREGKRLCFPCVPREPRGGQRGSKALDRHALSGLLGGRTDRRLSIIFVSSPSHSLGLEGTRTT